MAKAATAAATADKKKSKKKATRTVAPAKAGKKGKKSAAPKKKRHQGLDALAKLVDHPLVADLLAAGAIAAVAAIAADQQPGDKKRTSAKMVKTAGQAAATAIGKKLMDEFGAIKTAATDAAKKA